LHPQKNIIEFDDKIKKNYHEDILSHFSEIKIDFIGNLRTAFLMEEFLKYMENIKNTFILPSDMAKYEENYKSIKETIYSLNEVGKRARSHIKETLMQKLSDDEWDVWRCNTYIQVYRKKWKLDMDVHFELIESDRCQNTLILPKEYKIVIHSEGVKKHSINEKFKSIEKNLMKKY